MGGDLLTSLMNFMLENVSVLKLYPSVNSVRMYVPEKQYSARYFSLMSECSSFTCSTNLNVRILSMHSAENTEGVY